MIISAIVTNYNGWELGVLPEFLEAFLNGDYKNFELFLVDQASTDDSVIKVKKKFGKDKRLKIIENPVNNMSAGIVMAMKAAKGDYILFLNNDLYFEKGAIKNLVDFLQKNKTAALVQGKVVSYFDHQRIDDVGETMDVYGNPVTLGAGEIDAGQYEEETEVLSVTGAASLFRASLIKKLGYLDADYRIGYEDMDLALRARIAGHKCFFTPTATIYHKRAASTSVVDDKLRADIKYWFNKNRITTLFKNYEPSTLLRSLPVVLILFIALGFFEIFYKKLWRFGLTRFRAIAWFFLSLPILLDKRRQVQKLRKLPDAKAIMPFMAKGRLFRGFGDFLKSKKW